MGQVKMRRNAEPHHLMQQALINAQEFTEMGRPGIGNDQPNIEIAGRRYKRFQEPFLRQIQRKRTGGNAVGFGEAASEVFKQGKTPGNQDEMQATGSELARELLPDAR
jgi:hypothetical protein